MHNDFSSEKEDILRSEHELVSNTDSDIQFIDNEKLNVVAKNILLKYRTAFENLAK